MLGQFSGPYSSVNLKLVLLQNCFVIYRQLFLTFIASKSLKLSFSLNYVLKRADDLKGTSTPTKTSLLTAGYSICNNVSFNFCPEKCV